MSYLQIVKLSTNFICNLLLSSINILVGAVISRNYQFTEDCELEENHGCLVRVFDAKQILVF
jgi:hypothetical protein